MTIVRDAEPNEFIYIDSLRKREANALGFIPKEAYQSILERRRIRNRSRWLYCRIIVTVDNDDLTGFCYASFASEYAKIHQIAVQEDARRWHRASLLLSEIEREAAKRGNAGVKARVAMDLEANFFWRAFGYEPVASALSTFLNQKESEKKRQLWIYCKEFWYSEAMPLLEGESG